MNIVYLETRLSGGASNSNPSLSLGGVMSSTVLRSKVATGLAAITGVVIDDAPGSADGEGQLDYIHSTQSLQWTPFGGTAGDPVAVGTDGKYAIPGSAGLLMVTVAAAGLPTSDVNDAITVAQNGNNLWDDLNKTECYDGSIEYRCLYVHNTHPSLPYYGVTLHIQSQPTGSDNLAIGLDSAGTGDGLTTGVAETVVGEAIAPVGAVFSQPSTFATGLNAGLLLPGESRAFWQRRTMPSLTLTSTVSDIASLAITAAY